MDVSTIARGISIYAVPALMAIILHEVAHGWIAEKFGDTTARRAGRITLNPISHIDPIGTVILPLILIVTGSPYLFGWAKPVPVDFTRLRNPKKDMVWVALAGPGTNFVLALFSALLIRLIGGFAPNAVLFARPDVPAEFLRSVGVAPSILSPIVLMLMAAIFFNCALMTLNLIPIPPLDGSRILAGLLPPKAAYEYNKLERYGFLILIVFLFILPIGADIMWGAITVFIAIFRTIAGIGPFSGTV